MTSADHDSASLSISVMLCRRPVPNTKLIWLRLHPSELRHGECIYIDEDGLDWPESKLLRIPAEEVDPNIW